MLYFYSKLRNDKAILSSFFFFPYTSSPFYAISFTFFSLLPLLSLTSSSFLILLSFPLPSLFTFLTFSHLSYSSSSLSSSFPLWLFTLHDHTHSTKSLRTPSNMFVINLALMDFIMMLKTPVFILNSFNDGPVWGKLGCDIYGLMGAFSGVGASSSNAVIAYDRYK